MILALDIETSGLEWSSDILTIGAAWRDGESIQKKAWVVGMTDLFHTPLPPPQVMHEIGLLVEKAEWVAMHNASFDLSYLFRDRYISPQQVKRKIFCTYLTARMTGPRPKLSLDALCRQYGITDPRWASMKNQRKNLSGLAVESVLEYNEQDAKYTLMLAEKLWQESLALYGEEFTRKESDYCRVMAEIRVRGKKLHRQATQRKLDSSLELRRKILHGVLWPRQIESPNDRKGLIKYLRLQGVSDFLLTEKGNEQLDKFGLEHLNQDVYGEDVTKTIWAIQELRGLEKLIGTYLEPLLTEHSDANDVVHPSYSVGGTVTYRLSSSHPNGQNFPRELDDVVWEPYLQADYSQAELRIAAMASQETNLAKAFAKNADVHTETAMLMFDKVNDELRKRAKNMNFACVPMDGTDILTIDGWKKWYDIKIGETVLGHKDNTLVWTRVRDVLTYVNAPLVKLHNGYFKAIVTPNHRWWSTRRKYRKEERIYVEEFVETQNITQEHLLRLSFPAQTYRRLDITPNDAAVIAYLHVEGRLERGKYVGAPSQAGGSKVKFAGYIHQSKPEGIAEIEKVLTNVPHKVYSRKQDELLTYSLNPEYLRDLWFRAMLDEISLEQFVLRLGIEERKAFMHAILVAEGCRSGSTWTFSTNEGPVLDAMRLCAYLEGYDPGYNDRQKCIVVRMRKPYVTGQRLKIEPVGTAPVFCLVTDTGSWVMRQGQQIMLTGNSIYFAGPKTISERYDVEFDEALGLLRLHRKIYPRLHKTARRMIDVWKERGYLILISGKRLYATPDDLLRSYKAFNNAVQGSVGELVKNAMLEMDERGIVMIGQKHDSIDFPLGTDMEEVKEIMQDVLLEEFSTRVNPPVKMRADVEMKGYKENEQ